MIVLLSAAHSTAFAFPGRESQKALGLFFELKLNKKLPEQLTKSLSQGLRAFDFATRAGTKKQELIQVKEQLLNVVAFSSDLNAVEKLLVKQIIEMLAGNVLTAIEERDRRDQATLEESNRAIGEHNQRELAKELEKERQEELAKPVPFGAKGGSGAASELPPTEKRKMPLAQWPGDYKSAKSKPVPTENRPPLIVAIIDSGIDPLPELSDQIWVNSKEKHNGKDDDGNGYIDDINGYDFAAGSPNAQDTYGHGTYSASILAARPSKTWGGGINPFVKVMPLKVTKDNGLATDLTVVEAILYAVKNGAKIVQISLCLEPRSHLVDVAVGWARDHGALVIACANSQGKSTARISPASAPGVLTVGACDGRKRRSKFSGWGAHLDLVAPGESITGLRARNTDFVGYLSERERRSKAIRLYTASGTCSALPLVTGVASLIWQKQPQLTAEQVRQKLLMSCDDLDRPGWDKATGSGCLNFQKAMAPASGKFLEARIAAIKPGVYQKRAFLQIQGRAFGNGFRRRLLQIAYGPEPKDDQWQTISYDLTTVRGERQPLGYVPLSKLNKPGEWWVRSVVEDRQGNRVESRSLILK